MADWQWVLGPATGGHELSLTEARGRSVTWRLTSPSEAGFTIDGRHEQAAAVEELSTDLHVIRDRRILYRGRVGPTEDQLDADSHVITVNSLDYREVLNRRIMWPGAILSFDNVDQAQIMTDLLANTQVQDGGDIGSWVSPSTTGVKRDRTYEEGDSIGQRMQELSEVRNGFDWDVHPFEDTSPVDTVLQLYYPQRGEDRGVVLEYGGTLVQSITRQVDPAEYANAVRVTGEENTTPVNREASNVASRPEGRWDKVYGTTIKRQSALEQRADWQLDEAQALIPSYQVTLAHGAWRGPGHIWLGDTVQLVIVSGRLAVDTRLRVQEINARIDDDGEETITLTIGKPRLDLYRKIPLMLRRLADLERR